ncbi:MAG: response regulator [Deferribacteraceae bacterium]|jgi:signal transduction histidine kinase/DNA-binding response OmpR family regulator|nr:response regulator [Deferribacteraceae bacterium]
MKDFLRKHAVIITFGAAGLILLILVFFTNLLVNFSIKTLDYNIERRLIAVSKTAAALVTAEELETYREPADMEKPEYKALRQKLSDFSKEAEVLYVYYLREIDGNLHYIIDNDFDPETQVGLASEPQEISLTPGAVEALAGESVCAGLGSYTVGWDGLIYSLSPVYDAEGNVRALCGVDIMDKQIINMHKMYKVLFGIEIIAVIAVFASGLFTILKYRHEADRANKESESKTVFLAHTSHEIRTPMNAIIGMGELAAREYGSPKGLEYIGDIQQAGKNLLAIINDILDFSKIEAGNLQINSAPYDTASVFNDVLNIIRLRMDSKPIELKTDISPDIPAVMIGDETRIRQILLNLLNNAVKYTPKGFINFSATGKFISRNTIRLTFTVKDSGIGIKQDDIPKLFGNFARMEARRNKNIEGAGLGLAITKRLCQAMSGDVFVESKYGKGSVFTAQIVQTYIEKVGLGEIKKHEIKSEKKKTPLFKAPKAKILIVDDIAANLKVAEGLLTPYKAWIDTCTNAKEAIRLIEKNRYDLIFMDHMMPEMDGVEATDIIRREQDGYFKSVPIIALTANAVTGMKEMFLEKGFTDFLSKPIEIPKLYAIMNKWIPQDKQEEPINTDITGKDKKPKTNIFEIEGVDVNRGLALIGDINVYLEVLKLFCEDAKKRLETLKAPPENNEESIRNFVLHTHSLKSAAGSIGAMQTAEEAANLEAAGKSADFEIINTNLNSFTEHLADVINKIEQAIS